MVSGRAALKVAEFVTNGPTITIQLTGRKSSKKTGIERECVSVNYKTSRVDHLLTCNFWIFNRKSGTVSKRSF